MLFPVSLFLLLIILHIVDCQHCQLADQEELIQNRHVENSLDDLKTPKYVVYSKDQDSDALKHVFEGFKR